MSHKFFISLIGNWKNWKTNENFSLDPNILKPYCSSRVIHQFVRIDEYIKNLKENFEFQDPGKYWNMNS